MDNPYLDLYNGYGFAIVEGMDSQTAQLVASHAALMHNALGYAIRDLVRVISFKYAGEQAEHRPTTTTAFEEVIRRQVA